MKPTSKPVKANRTQYPEIFRPDEATRKRLNEIAAMAPCPPWTKSGIITECVRMGLGRFEKMIKDKALMPDGNGTTKSVA